MLKSQGLSVSAIADRPEQRERKPGLLKGKIRIAPAIGFQHAERAGALAPLHSDPFDRMLIARALLEDLVLVTADRSCAQYGVQLVFAVD